MEKTSYYLEETAFPDDITYCAAETCERESCARHLYHAKHMKYVTSDGRELPALFSLADFGEICTDYIGLGEMRCDACSLH